MIRPILHLAPPPSRQLQGWSLPLFRELGSGAEFRGDVSLVAALHAGTLYRAYLLGSVRSSQGIAKLRCGAHFLCSFSIFFVPKQMLQMHIKGSHCFVMEHELLLRIAFLSNLRLSSRSRMLSEFSRRLPQVQASQIAGALANARSPITRLA